MNYCRFYRISVPPREARRRSAGILLLLMLTVFLGIAVPVASAKGEEEEPPPAPQEITLDTADGVKLSAVYYEGTEGEKTIPVIVIHDWEEKGTEYELLAEYLQSQDYAVVLPDLRGHGGSTLKKISSGRAEKLTPRGVDPRNIIAGDLEAIRKFLLKKNNAKKLNINATCIIGVGKGAILATYYAIYDWDSQFRSPNRSQASAITKTRGGEKDVKALVLVSPDRKIKTYNIDALWKHPTVGTSDISTLILVGDKKVPEDKRKPSDTREVKTAKNIYQRLKKNHTVQGDDVGKWTLFFKSLDTELNGETLLTETDLGLGARADIRAFLNLRLRDPELVWKGKEDRPSWP